MLKNFSVADIGKRELNPNAKVTYYFKSPKLFGKNRTFYDILENKLKKIWNYGFYFLIFASRYRADPSPSKRQKVL